LALAIGRGSVFVAAQRDLRQVVLVQDLRQLNLTPASACRSARTRSALIDTFGLARSLYRRCRSSGGRFSRSAPQHCGLGPRDRPSGALTAPIPPPPNPELIASIQQEAGPIAVSPFTLDCRLEPSVTAHHLDLRHRSGEIFGVSFELGMGVGKMQKRQPFAVFNYSMSRSAFSLITSRLSRAISSCSGFIRPWPGNESRGSCAMVFTQLRSCVGCTFQVLRCPHIRHPASLHDPPPVP
jgi:hypothetical protein